jgi:hypothetical protein
LIRFTDNDIFLTKRSKGKRMVPESDTAKAKGQPPEKKGLFSVFRRRVPTSTPLELVVKRNAFYDDAYHRLMQIFLLLIVLNAGLIGFGIVESKLLPYPTYFFTSPTGVPMKIIPPDRPNMSDPALLQWAVEAATNAYTFNFVNYRQSLQESSAYFTKKGYTAFLSALKESRHL